MGSWSEGPPPEGRPARTDVDFHPLIGAHWSPRAFAELSVEPEKLRALFEAARWAPSAFNDQPWRFLVAAEENLCLQAYAEGLVVHQMAGFAHECLKSELLPDGFEPGTMAAIGYPGDPETLDETRRERERRSRRRKPPSRLVFGPGWAVSARFLGP